MRKIWATAVLATVTVVTGTTGVRSDDKKTDMTAEKLVGTYQIVKGEEYGGKPPKEDVTKVTVKFTKDRITAFDGNNKELYVQTYKLDPSKKPMGIMMTNVKPSEGMKAKGLIEVEGDTLKLIYALPGGEMPTEFKTKAKQLMFEMTKKK